MNCKFLFVGILLVISSTVFTQRIISGIVKAAENEERLPFADLVI
jgi:hypothetical protein